MADSVKSSDRAKFPCSECSREFANERALNRHYGREHISTTETMPEESGSGCAPGTEPTLFAGLELPGSFEVYVLKGFLALPPFPPDMAKTMGPQRLTFPFKTDLEGFQRKVGSIIFRIDDLTNDKKYVIKDGTAERQPGGAMKMELRFDYAIGQHSNKDPAYTHTVPKTMVSNDDYREMLEKIAEGRDDAGGQFIVMWQPGKAPRDKISIRKAAQWNYTENHRLVERKRTQPLWRSKVIIGGKELWIPDQIIGMHDDCDDDRMVRVRWVDAEEETAEFLFLIERDFPELLDSFLESSGITPDRTGNLGNKKAICFDETMGDEHRNLVIGERKLEKAKYDLEEGFEVVKELDSNQEDTDQWATEHKRATELLALLQDLVNIHEKKVEALKKKLVVPEKRFGKRIAILDEKLEQAGKQAWKNMPDSGAVDLSSFSTSQVDNSEKDELCSPETDLFEGLKIKEAAEKEQQDRKRDDTAAKHEKQKKAQTKPEKSSTWERRGHLLQPSSTAAKHEKQMKAQTKLKKSETWEPHGHLLQPSSTAADAWRYARRGGYVNYAENKDNDEATIPAMLPTNNRASGPMRKSRYTKQFTYAEDEDEHKDEDEDEDEDEMEELDEDYDDH